MPGWAASHQDREGRQVCVLSLRVSAWEPSKSCDHSEPRCPRPFTRMRAGSTSQGSTEGQGGSVLNV